jgi:membrane protein YdbS with pleckstrin-like domain
MSDRSLIRRSPNSLILVIALAFALLTTVAGVLLLLGSALRHSNWSVDRMAVTPDPESDSVLHLPVVVLIAAICLLVLPLIWRYRQRIRKAISPEL